MLAGKGMPKGVPGRPLPAVVRFPPGQEAGAPRTAGESMSDFRSASGVSENGGVVRYGVMRRMSPESGAGRCYPRPPRLRAIPERQPAASGRRAMPAIRRPDRKTGRAVEGMDVRACGQATVAAVRNTWLFKTPPPFPECVDLRTGRSAVRRTG